MRTTFLFQSFLLISLSLFSQEPQKIGPEAPASFPFPRVDKRIELLSIVFRLAGNREYNSEEFKAYTMAIHKHFDPFKDHPAVAFASKMRMEKGVSYDAVMKMAFHVSQPPALAPKVEFNSEVPEKRWGKEDALKFLELLHDFYLVSDFEKFYQDHAALYALTEERFLSVYKAVKVDWYSQYYGIQPNGSFNIIVCLGNGGSNYGGKVVYPDLTEEAFAIMGTWTIDSSNNPWYKPEYYLSTLIHEFNHSYVNPLVDKFSSKLEKSGQMLFEPLKETMRRQAYGNWKTMYCESLVRASVIRYQLKNDSYNAARNQLIAETGNGFYWMQGLVNKLGEYEKNRITYPDLESFMPVLVEFFNQTARESETRYEIKQ